MLTGFPPFQSNSQEEIYRKVKSLEYVWPKDFDGSCNYIPKEAKDLVSSCLNLNPEERPEPDDIVDHNFFKMYLRCIPRTLDSSCRVSKPVWLRQQDPRGDAIELAFGMDADTTYDFYSSCGVGRDSRGKVWPCVGEKADKTASLECLEEEQNGQNPVVPVPENAIYSPDYKLDQNGRMIPRWDENRERLHEDMTESTINISRATSMSSVSVSIEMPIRSIPTVRLAPQSHAATLRQQARPPRPTPTERYLDGGERRALTAGRRRNPTIEHEHDIHPPRVRPPLGYLSRPSVRSSSRIASARESCQNLQPEIPTLTRFPTTGDIRADTHRRQRSINASTSTQKSAEERAASGQEAAMTSENLEEHKKAKPSTQEEKYQAKESALRKTSSENTINATLIDPNDTAETISLTTPNEVLAQLRTLLQNLKVEAKRLQRGDRPRARKENPNQPVVNKWVDYTNKFGIGYILSDGTVGCLFNATKTIPCSSIAVRGGEEHLRKKKLDNYPDRNQLVPLKGPEIEFFENSTAGTKRVFVPPAEFNVDLKVDKSSTEYNSPYYQEKLKRVSLWDKFGKYMTASLGKEEDDKLIAEAEKKTPSDSDASIVKFYQRCGNVGIWGFGDGSFQFNFPDHTKLIVSSQGTWIDFYHLQIPDAIHIRKLHTLPAGALEKRACLSMQTAQMKFSESSSRSTYKNTLKENYFAEKMGWVIDIIGRWVENAGLGELGETGKNKPGYIPGSDGEMGKDMSGYWFWEGSRELVLESKDKGKGGKEGWMEKLVWVSVGAVGGRDTGYEALVRVVGK
jgi:hypothetical protein